jgi:hypothetical protein
MIELKGEEMPSVAQIWIERGKERKSTQHQTRDKKQK